MDLFAGHDDGENAGATGRAMRATRRAMFGFLVVVASVAVAAGVGGDFNLFAVANKHFLNL